MEWGIMTRTFAQLRRTVPRNLGKSGFDEINPSSAVIRFVPMCLFGVSTMSSTTWNITLFSHVGTVDGKMMR